MVINTNLSGQVSANNLQNSQAMLSKSLARLSSGSKLVNPSDDAAGLAVATRLDGQIQRLQAAKANIANAVSFTQTQDGYLKKIGKALDRMSELAVFAQDATKSDGDRDLYNSEFRQLADFIGSASDKEFNGVPLFSSATIEVNIDSEGTAVPMQMLGIDLNIAAYTDVFASNLSTVADAGVALANVKIAITQLSTDRATIGSYQTRLNYTSDQLTISRENLTAASSRIQDVDVAEESTEYAKANILVQAGTAMLAQANSMPQSVLKLLQ